MTAIAREYNGSRSKRPRCIKKRGWSDCERKISNVHFKGECQDSLREQHTTQPPLVLCYRPIHHCIRVASSLPEVRLLNYSLNFYD
jgi:hypothetical protein